jgi:hypothetical protein
MRELCESDLRWVSGGWDSYGSIELYDCVLWADNSGVYAGYQWDDDDWKLTVTGSLSDFDTVDFHFTSDRLDLDIRWNEDTGSFSFNGSYTSGNWTYAGSANSNGSFTVSATLRF